jgi:hypothetical protein
LTAQRGASDSRLGPRLEGEKKLEGKSSENRAGVSPVQARAAL